MENLPVYGLLLVIAVLCVFLILTLRWENSNRTKVELLSRRLDLLRHDLAETTKRVSRIELDEKEQAKSVLTITEEIRKDLDDLTREFCILNEDKKEIGDRVGNFYEVARLGIETLEKKFSGLSKSIDDLEMLFKGVNERTNGLANNILNEAKLSRTDFATLERRLIENSGHISALQKENRRTTHNLAYLKGRVERFNFTAVALPAKLKSNNRGNAGASV